MLFLFVILTFLMLGALGLAAVLNEHDIHPLRKMAEWMRRCSVLEVALVAIMAAGPIYRAGSKTNGVPDRGCSPVPGSAFRVEVVSRTRNPQPETRNLPTTNYQLPTTNLDWLASGGYEDWFYLGDGGWCFRFGSNLVERLTVFSCGEISSAPFGASNRISLLGIPLSIVPAANWHLIAGNGEQGTGNGNPQPSTLNPKPSLFWHCVTPSNTLLLTWENALVRRDTNQPLTVQAELFPDGAVALLYDFSGIGDICALSNAETQIWRDGVLASNYQPPTTNYQLSTTNYQLNTFFDAPPITGTNMIGEVQARIAGGNTNAYYCADVVVAKGPAKIRVEPMADETNQGLLGAYEIVGMPGETNRLPLLIGPKYTVSAEAAFESFELVPPPFVPLADDTGTVERLEFGEAFSATNVTDRLVEVQWPVEFALEEIDAVPESTTYALRVTPDWLDGEVTWHGIADTNAPPMRGAPPMRSGGDSCSCGCLARDGLDLIHYLSCECEHCYAEGECLYEGHTERIGLDMKDPSSGSGGNSPGGGSGNQPDPGLPSVSVSFEKDVLIFEAPYEIEPGVVTNPPPSTRTKLTLSAHGGENGGTLYLLLGSELKIVSDSDPIPSSVPPYGSVEWEGYCEATNASPNIRGTVTKARIIENLTGNKVESRAKRVTAVQIRVTPNKVAPDNYCTGRHKYGVCEVVNCFQSPSAPKVVWTAINGSFKENTSYVDFICPLYATSNPLEASIGDVIFVPNISVVEPQGIIATNAVKINYGEHPNKAGYVGMQLQLYVTPMDVSFDEIAVEEVPSDQGEHFGHFTNTYFSSRWSHTRTNGAGDWIDVGSKADGEEGEFPNRFGVDTAAYEGIVPCFRPDGTAIAQPDSTTSWSYGYMYWANPFGWNIKGTKGHTAPFREFATSTIDEFYILLDGTMSIMKLQNTVARMTNDCVYLNGVLQ